MKFLLYSLANQPLLFFSLPLSGTPPTNHPHRFSSLHIWRSHPFLFLYGPLFNPLIPLFFSLYPLTFLLSFIGSSVANQPKHNHDHHRLRRNESSRLSNSPSMQFFFSIKRNDPSLEGVIGWNQVVWSLGIGLSSGLRFLGDHLERGFWMWVNKWE